MRIAVLISGLAALVIAAVVGFLIGRAISDPLLSLASTARRMADGDMSARASLTRRDEIGDLAHQFNGMAENLESTFKDLRSERDSLKRFVADASHELRTPITALATFNELLQGSAANDPEARQEFLQESATQLARLQWITSNLLDLSRLDAGIAGLVLATTNAGDIVQAAIVDSRARASDKAVQLALELPAEPVLLVCDGKRMEIAVGNLVSNAVKFVQPGGAVTVRVEADELRVRFIVSDDGPGISTEDAPHIFERFYRGRGTNGEGAGLGLAITQSVAQAHGGSIGVTTQPGQGSIFTLDLPRGRPSVA
jgi:signal transduction histidine kinase